MRPDHKPGHVGRLDPALIAQVATTATNATNAAADLEILRLARDNAIEDASAAGWSNPAIARAAGCTEKTIRRILQNLKQL